MSIRKLDSLFEPASIAVMGAWGHESYFSVAQLMPMTH